MNIFEEIKESISNFFKETTTKYDKSNKWKEYKLGETFAHCETCINRQNKIYDKNNIPSLPEHFKCLCYLRWMRKVLIGSATNRNVFGADYYLANYKTLPNYYITKEDAENLGWVAWKGNLDKVAPGEMIGGNVFANRENKLPSAPGRIWFECDIDYNGGFRNNCRLIYSNDGLIFKTDSHYTDFIAVE